MLLACGLYASYANGLSYHDPLDFGTWERFRTQVQHPCGLYRQSDIDRVRRRIETDPTAKSTALVCMKQADAALAQLTPEYLQEWIPSQRGFGYMGPCPACRDKGLRWHPNGTWTWDKKKPDQVLCTTCKTAFPNEKYPETIHFESKWEPGQVYSYCGGEPFKMYGVLCRPSFSGMVRTRKLFSTFSLLTPLTYAYIYSGDAKYADGIRRMLLRYAEVLPHYLFGASIYNELADCDPHVAAKDPFNLPTDEITPPPNKPDRKIHVGYWMGSRLGSTSQDGDMAVAFSLAYDIACTAKWPDGRQVFTAEECYRIEKDLLLELTWHFASKEKIDNKSVCWRAASAAVGCVVGHPDLARFGMDGLYKTIYEWFLPDFTTSESGGYLMMVMLGIKSFPLWFRDYSEPEGYEPPDGGKPLRHFNLFRDTDYGICWQNAINTLQGNLIYPPVADTLPETRDIPKNLCDQLPICNPTPRNLSFFALNNKGRISSPHFALLFGYNGDDGAVPNFTFEDNVFPYLQQGFFRYGPQGRDGLAMLNASDYGGHHHLDSLGLYLWHKNELLNDLGYLWDHPDKKNNVRTVAHNLVVVDEKSQISKGRGGSFSLFETAGRIKVMRASSTAYEQTTLYERTLLQVDHGDAGFYWLDLFRVQGGKTRDYVFHGVSRDFTITGAELPSNDAMKPVDGETRFCLKFAMDQLGTWEFSDAELYRIDKTGRHISDNLASEFPEAVPPGSKTCKGWGFYKGNGKATWEPCQGKSGRGVRYHALSIAPNLNVVNHALCIGECDGFRGTNAFLGKPGERYAYRFFARGDKGSMKAYLLQFLPGEENSPDGRRQEVVSINSTSLGGEWQLYEGTFTLPPQERVSLVRTQPAILQAGAGKGAWKATWSIAEDQQFSVFSPYHEGETLLFANDWGQRFYDNRDRGTTIPYFFRRRNGLQRDSFAAVFHSFFYGKELVKDVATVESDDGIVAIVKTILGEDVFLFAADGRMLRYGDIASDADIACVLNRELSSRYLSMFGGTMLQCGAKTIQCEQASFTGRVKVAVNHKDEAYFVLEGELPSQGYWKGHTLIVTGEDGVGRPYQIVKSAWVDGAFRAYTRVDGMGLPAREAKSWLLPNKAFAEF